jgi:pyridoxal phosphate enzyme (YggS family)
MATVSANLAAIQARIQAAALRAGRDPGSITLLAVSKFNGIDRIKEAALAGLKHFAESRQQEAQTKLPLLKGLGEWHFIGPLQTNKAKPVAELFDVIQSVDSLRLAEKLNAAALALGKIQRVYAQLNISREPQKQGFEFESAPDALRLMAGLPGLKLEGLMGMAALSDDPEDARPAFREFKKFRDAAAPQLLLSMGMSHDYETAIEEGADLLRIGSALFQ